MLTDQEFPSKGINKDKLIEMLEQVEGNYLISANNLGNLVLWEETEEGYEIFGFLYLSTEEIDEL